MPDKRRATCRRCRGHRSVVGLISWSGLCRRCGTDGVLTNIEQMHNRHGPNFNAWRRAMAACVGGALLDDAGGSGHTHDHDG